MITTLRRLFGSKFGAAIALAFVVLVGFAFAIGDVTSNANFGVSEGQVVRVGNEQISANRIKREVQQALQQAREQQPGLTMEAFVAAGGLDNVIKQLVDGEAFDQYASKLGFGVSDRQVDGRLADLPVFQGATGKFDRTRFEQFLAQNGLTEAQVRTDLRRQILLEQVAQPIGRLPAIGSSLAAPYAALVRESRQGQAIFIPASSFAPTTVPDDATITKFLAQNRAKYSLPERRIVRYAIFDRAAVPVPAVTDAEIAAEFKNQAGRYAARETRAIAQVIAPSQSVAQQIVARAKGGSSLGAAAQASGLAASTAQAPSEAELAKTAGAAAAKAAFSGKVGDVSGPHQGALGWVVVRIDGITRMPAKSLAEATPELRAALATNKQNEAVFTFYNGIQDAVNAGASLDEIASDRKLALVETPAILPGGRAPDAPDYAPPAILGGLFSQAFQAAGPGEAQIATLVENEAFAVFEVKSVLESAPPPLAKIKPTLIADWQRAQGAKVARDRAGAMVKAVEGGKSLADAAQAVGGKTGSIQTIGGKRGDIARGGQGVPPELALLFSMAEGTVKRLEMPGNTGWMVIQLTKVDRPAAKDIEPELLAQVAPALARAMGNEYVQQFVNAARQAVGVKTDAEALAALKAELSGALRTAQ